MVIYSGFLKRYRRGLKRRGYGKRGFSLPGPILPTRPMWQFWASETLQKQLINASATLQKRSTSGLYLLLDVYMHYGSFHGRWARRCGALLARGSMILSSRRALRDNRYRFKITPE